MIDDPNCPDPEALASLLSGVPGPGHESVVAHLHGCARCRRALADAADVGDEIEYARQGTTIGRYTIHDTLGVGGMGIVYRAHDTELGRDVALKLALRTTDCSVDLERLHDEAKALARLSHPNVVTVYDVGWLGPNLFLVMEYVRGRSLARWLASDPPPEIDVVLERFASAGEGLLAIHRAGVLHGDFKPSNAVVGDDGQVRVIDFGLAGRSVSSEVTLPARGDETPSGPVLTSIRQDTQAFAGALLEALCGVRPTDADWALALHRSKAPRAVRRQLQETLRRTTTRLGSFDAELGRLVDVLRAARPRSGRVVAVVVATAAFAAWGVEAVVRSSSETQACQESAERLRGVWDSERRRTIHQGFAEQGAGFGEHAWARVEARLDAYAQRWSQRARDGCLRTDAGDPRPRLDACVAARRASLAAVTEVLANADPVTVMHAQRIVDTLPDPEHCEPARADLDPDYAAQLQRVLVLRSEGRAESGLDAAVGLGELAATSADVRARAEAAIEIGHFAAETLQPERALTQLQLAVRWATEAGDTGLVVRAYTDQASVLAVGLGRTEDGMAALQTADALVDQGLSQAAIDRARANLQLHAGRYDACAESAERALKIVRSHRATTPRAWLADLRSVASCRSAGGDADAARAAAAEALAIATRAYGPSHPRYAAMLRVAGVVARNAGDENASEPLARAAEAYERLEATGTVESAQLTQTLNNLAGALTNEGRAQDAIAVRRRVLARVDAAPSVAGRRLRARVLLAQDLIATQAFDDANTVLDQAESIAATMPQPNPHLESGIGLYRGIIADRREQGEVAVVELRRARALLQPMREEADVRDNLMPYLSATIAWYELERDHASGREALALAADAASASTDPCVRAVVFTRAAAVVGVSDPRGERWRERARQAESEGLSSRCYLAPVVERLGLKMVD